MESTCGRPLGLKFNSATCDLYIADAYFGLLWLAQVVALQSSWPLRQGVPFRFTNGLDIDTQTGEVYFTESSIIFQRRSSSKVIITIFLIDSLAFPNGVALSKDNSFLLLAESTTSKILKVQLGDSKTNYVENFAQLRRPPDNIKRSAKGEFWVALNSGRERSRDWKMKLEVPYLKGQQILWELNLMKRER
ncbi:Strictosidine synthase, conserved region [Sesbania bispinosa]|nr:Strictosidine synthase, conserved region [Sesbania bispinosa]